MPLNYSEIYRQIAEKVPRLRKRQERRRAALEAALQNLQQARTRQEALQHLVERATHEDHNLRCALPTQEPLDAAVPPPPFEEPLAFLASDGSQIFPDHHRPVYFGLVNVALVLVTPETSAWFVDSYLLLEEDFPHDLPAEALVRLERMVREHTWLAQAARHLYGEAVTALVEAGWPQLPAHLPLVAMVDGPLEVWGVQHARQKPIVRRVIAAWDVLRARSAVLLGYVERPLADLVMNALALAHSGEAVPQRIWPGVHDALLFSRLLPPGYRSALFALQTATAAEYYGEHRVHFFYMNIGDPERPHIVRVEVPAWVAQEKDRLARVHAGLQHHLRAVARSRYPYLLYQAHERAVIREQDRRDLERRLEHFLREAGLPVPRLSAKQRLKERRPRP